MEALNYFISEIETEIDEEEDLKNDTIVKSQLLEFHYDSDDSSDDEFEDDQRREALPISKIEDTESAVYNSVKYDSNDGSEKVDTEIAVDNCIKDESNDGSQDVDFQSEEWLVSIPLKATSLDCYPQPSASSCEIILPDCPPHLFESESTPEACVNSPYPVNYGVGVKRPLPDDRVVTKIAKVEPVEDDPPEAILPDLSRVKFEVISSEDECVIEDGSDCGYVPSASENQPETPSILEVVDAPSSTKHTAELSHFTIKEEVIDLGSDIIKLEPSDVEDPLDSCSNDVVVVEQNENSCENEQSVSSLINAEKSTGSQQIIATPRTVPATRKVPGTAVYLSKSELMKTLPKQLLYPPSNWGTLPHGSANFTFGLNIYARKGVQLIFICARCGKAVPNFKSTLTHFCYNKKNLLPKLLCGYCFSYICNSVEFCLSHMEGAIEQYQLTKHLKAYPCCETNCHFMTFSISCFSIHVEQAHQNEVKENSNAPPKIYYCYTCHIIFNSSAIWRAHKKSAEHTEKMTKKFKYFCDECNYQAVYLSSLRVHLKLAHKKTLNDPNKDCDDTLDVFQPAQEQSSRLGKFQPAQELSGRLVKFQPAQEPSNMLATSQAAQEPSNMLATSQAAQEPSNMLATSQAAQEQPPKPFMHVQAPIRTYKPADSYRKRNHTDSVPCDSSIN